MSLHAQPGVRYDELLSGHHPFRLTLEYRREIDGERHLEGYEGRLREVSSRLAAAYVLVKPLLELLPASGVRKGDELRYEWAPCRGLGGFVPRAADG